jgi:epoxyqueuosine reductase
MIEEIIESTLVPSTDFIYGFANVSGLLPMEFEKYPTGISIGKRLDDRIIDSIENGPTLKYLDHYHNINNELSNLSSKICHELKNLNINCINIIPTVPVTGDEAKSISKTLRYKVSHKMIATRAGLGWIGKTDLFISNAFGPRLRLVSILIDKPVNITANTIDRSKCGKCDICVKSCPAQAANGTLWDINTDRDLFFDAHKCREKCAELARLLMKKNTRICGICVSVCPLGRQKN